MKIPRRHVREFAVQALYQAAVDNIPAAEAAKNIREVAEFGKADEGLFNKLVIGIVNNAAAYMQQIHPLLDRDEEDLGPIGRAVLLVVCHELSTMPETSYLVIINEAIEVIKTFDGTDGHKLVNGILDRLVTQLHPNDPKRGV